MYNTRKNLKFSKMNKKDSNILKPITQIKIIHKTEHGD